MRCAWFCEWSTHRICAARLCIARLEGASPPAAFSCTRTRTTCLLRERIRHVRGLLRLHGMVFRCLYTRLSKRHTLCCICVCSCVTHWASKLAAHTATTASAPKVMEPVSTRNAGAACLEQRQVLVDGRVTPAPGLRRTGLWRTWATRRMRSHRERRASCKHMAALSRSQHGFCPGRTPSQH